ncbi:hypothetical protein [Maribrevibacterium harenarium]|uniref:hypothetical protein n=1 Tax=Maribrevibacterium harenarium TaxID=2589817 RepID=UPI0038B28928
MSTFKKNLLAAAVGTIVATSTIAAETTLRVATWLPPTNPQNETVWPTWEKWVECSGIVNLAT